MTDIGNLLGEAATLMFTGMTVVFIFLTILIYIVKLMSNLVPEESPLPTAMPIQNSTIQQTLPAVNPQVVAAISAAVHQYRNSASNK